MATVYFNWQGPTGRETIDEISRSDFPVGREGFKDFRKETQRLLEEYALAGMNAYPSSRPCANWKEKEG